MHLSSAAKNIAVRPKIPIHIEICIVFLISSQQILELKG
jgi:hypothetical protein